MDQLLFAQTHEWVKLGADQSYWVGISNHAQEALGDVMFLQLPEVGASVKQGQVCATIESLKAASDIHAPLSGTIVASNSAAVDTPEIINAKPYDVWLFKIKPEGRGPIETEMKSLLIPVAYERSI